MVVFVLDKFWLYLLESKVLVYSNHTALRYLLFKKDTKPRLNKWILLLQAFDLEIWEMKGSKNMVADHISRILVEHTQGINMVKERFLKEQLFALNHSPWFSYIINYLAIG